MCSSDLVVAVFAVPRLHRTKVMEDATATTDGEITGQEDIGRGDHDMWVDVVEYYAEGRYYRLKGNVRGKDTGGSAVRVHYVPGNPKRAWAERIPSEPEGSSPSRNADERLR